MITKERLQRSIKRTKQQLEQLEGRRERLSKYGYWEIGYLKGKIEVLEDWLDEMEEEETYDYKRND